jgi:hypothetical protein
MGHIMKETAIDRFVSVFAEAQLPLRNITGVTDCPTS